MAPNSEALQMVIGSMRRLRGHPGKATLRPGRSGQDQLGPF